METRRNRRIPEPPSNPFSALNKLPRWLVWLIVAILIGVAVAELYWR